ncbi:uncharacterized protein YecE (DUF72 family) [Humibacillus xanthopallidus]|uniref:Uncharacterized protein YecE (DUF72 family) n=1 Tax=Humibacillus xanthopallidus TaxID=412689 RepID=A0A543PKN6_9MICO|nr:DUF72 domain-containing protein [Humibacillus xanthopallidus]TQN44623.1 uncharacterized protein YecE (DUF72 family) [Humibacillus xanthopallidus]
MDVRVGLCGWTVSQASYVQRFPVLEVQHTFYEPPSDGVLTRWRSQVPADFEFTIKAWQIVTHESNSPTYRRMKRPLPEDAHGQVGGFRTTPTVLAGWERTLECARVLRATAVLLQCPKSFRPTAENVQRLRDFVGQVERPVGRLLWEPRGEWPTQLLTELCAELDLVHVVDPMQTETVTPEQTYYRLHGTKGSRHVHTDDELLRLRDRVVGRPSPYVMFNNLPRVRDAERFLALLSEAGV